MFKSTRQKTAYPVFKDPRLEQQITADGMITMPWLDGAEIASLKAIVTDIHSRTDFEDVHIRTGFRLSAFNNGEVYKRELYERIYPLLKDKIGDLLNDYIPLLINVFEKEWDKEHNEVDIHQNPSFVEEPAYRSVSIWIPLQDVYKENGSIGVLKGSHGKFYHVRASNMPMVYDDVAESLVTERFEPVVLKAGSIAVLEDSIIHWSYPNYAEPIRTAIQLIMVPREAKHIYFYHKGPVVEKYAVTPEYFFKFKRNNFPEGLPKIGEVKYTYTNIQESQL